MTAAATVLVLEDHPALLMHAVGIVEDFGMEAFSSLSTSAAVKMLTEHPEIGAVFADLDTAGCDSLLSAVQRQRPDVGLILTSTSVSRTDPRIPVNALFLQKPFSPDDLEGALAKWRLAGTKPC